MCILQKDFKNMLFDGCLKTQTNKDDCEEDY